MIWLSEAIRDKADQKLLAETVQANEARQTSHSIAERLQFAGDLQLPEGTTIGYLPYAGYSKAWELVFSGTEAQVRKFACRLLEVISDSPGVRFKKVYRGYGSYKTLTMDLEGAHETIGNLQITVSSETIPCKRETYYEKRTRYICDL